MDKQTEITFKEAIKNHWNRFLSDFHKPRNEFRIKITESKGLGFDLKVITHRSEQALITAQFLLYLNTKL